MISWFRDKLHPITKILKIITDKNIWHSRDILNDVVGNSKWCQQVSQAYTK